MAKPDYILNKIMLEYNMNNFGYILKGTFKANRKNGVTKYFYTEFFNDVPMKTFIHFLRRTADNLEDKIYNKKSKIKKIAAK